MIFMSLRFEPIPTVPKETARVARAAFPKSNMYLKMRDELGTFSVSEKFRVCKSNGLRRLKIG